MQGRSSVEKGFTLIELMVSLTIGLFIILGVLVVYVGGLRSYSVNDALSRVQESGRFALEFLARDVRVAGFQAGCDSVNNLLNETSSDYSEDLHLVAGGIKGWDDSAGDYSDDMYNYEAGTDVLLVKNAATETGLVASGNTPANANTINLTTASGIDKGTIILVADSEGCDLFQTRNNANASTLTRGASSNNPGPGNKNPGSNDFSHQYDGDMEIYTLDARLYYIGEGGNGRPALRRTSLTEDGVLDDDAELVSGIEDMQIEYGVDTDDDQNVDEYQDASEVADWDEVLAARISLLAAGDTENVLEVETESLPAPYNAEDTSDKRLRKVFTATVALRNKLP